MYYLHVEIDTLLRYLPGPMAEQWRDAVEVPFEFVGGDVDDGWGRFNMLVSRNNWMGVGVYYVKRWWHTMHCTGNRDYDCGREFGVFESRVMEAHGVEIGSDGEGSLVYDA